MCAIHLIECVSLEKKMESENPVLMAFFPCSSVDANRKMGAASGFRQLPDIHPRHPFAPSVRLLQIYFCKKEKKFQEGKNNVVRPKHST